VSRTHYDSDREVYAWRHEIPGGKSPTLRVTRHVLEQYPAFVVLYHLDQLKVAQAIRARFFVTLSKSRPIEVGFPAISATMGAPSARSGASIAGGPAAFWPGLSCFPLSPAES
jgi:hypothetical protein